MSSTDSRRYIQEVPKGLRFEPVMERIFCFCFHPHGIILLYTVHRACTTLYGTVRDGTVRYETNPVLDWLPTPATSSSLTWADGWHFSLLTSLSTAGSYVSLLQTLSSSHEESLLWFDQAISEPTIEDRIIQEAAYILHLYLSRHNLSTSAFSDLILYNYHAPY
jgi:hypothetical protein